jgi:hypothetical protein
VSRRIPATIVNHVAIDIAADADAVWQVILHEIVEARSFRDLNAMTALDDPNVPLGGYRTTLDDGEGGIDERVIHVTERDEAARRVSVRADFVSDPGGTQVYATYQARETPGGACFTIDCHTRLELDVPDGADVGAIIARDTAHYDTEMTARLEKVKTRLEGAE